MGRIGRVAGLLAGVAVLVGLVTGCEPNYEVKRTEVNLALPCNGTTTIAADWAIPQGVTPTGFVWLQHGFARSNDNMASLETRYASRGWIVVTPNLAAFGSCNINDSGAHSAIASLLAGSTAAGSNLEASYDAARTKLGLPAANLPANFVLSGHSAGGAAMTVVGGLVNTNASSTVRARLKGLVLLDPVENSGNGMAAQLPNLANKPVYTISGGDSSCNSNSSGTKALLPRRSGFVGVRLPSGCHCDAEGDSTDGLCTLVCGTPKAANKDALKQLAGDWVSDLLAGKVTASAYPGGDYYEKTKAAGTISTLTGTA